MCGGRDWNTGAVKEQRTANRVRLETCSMKAPDIQKGNIKSYSPFFTPLACSAHGGYWGDLPSKEEPRTKHSTHCHHVREDTSVAGDEIVHFTHLNGPSQRFLDLV